MNFPSYETFHKACFRQDPDAWQIRLAAEMEGGEVPEIVAIPTGLGKSMLVPIAIWATAAQMTRGHRTLPQRIVHVVDRRQVIDEAHARMEQVVRALDTPELSIVKTTLEALAGPWQEPVAFQRIHGAAGDSGSWLRPTGCSVLSMTTHQLVSRLLFRGLGVSARTRSIPAGLLGVDSLIVLDEPQLSHQALATMRQVLQQQADAPGRLDLPPSRLVLLGATVPTSMAAGSARWELNESERKQPRVRQLLTTAKPVSIQMLDGPDSALVKALVEQARSWTDAGASGRRIGIFVNTVATAVAVHAGLTKAKLEPTLVTSRMRPTDRSTIDLKQARLVVSTQCLEVGPDVTFDDLATEAAPLPTLIQRFGRHNRDARTEGPRGAIFVSPQVRRATEAVYGAPPVEAAQAFLAGQADRHGIVDFSLQAQQSWPADAVAACEMPEPRLATFHSGYHATITTTFPTPFSDLPLDTFISGPDSRRSLDVLVAWRAEPHRVQEGCTPLSAEQVSVPLASARAFLAGLPAPVMSDVAGSAERVASVPRGAPVVTVLVRRDDAWVELESVAQLRPGDEVVLESSAGGYRAGVGWDASSTEPVSDHSAVSAWSSKDASLRGGHLFPVTPATLGPLLRREPELVAGGVDPLARCLGWLDEAEALLREEPVAPEHLSASATAAGLPAWQFAVLADGALAAAWPSQRDRSARRAKPEGLKPHQERVASVIAAGGLAAGLNPQLMKSAVLAGRTHDEGKSHESFQRFLGNFSADDVWAKSTNPSATRVQLRRRAKAAGHSLKWRHEGLSAEMATRARFDPLTVHLNGSHHGRFRPLLNSSAEGLGQEELPGRAETFVELNRELGPWGLAYLEALVRLSDWFASAMPELPKLDPAPAVPSDAPTVGAVSQGSADAPKQVSLWGLLPTPMTGWFAMAGLLAQAQELGDASAAVWWEPTGASAPTPMWQSQLPLHDVVSAALGSEQWNLLSRLGTSLTDSFTKKSQKLAPALKLSELVAGAAHEGAWLALGIATDAAPAEPSGVPMPIVAAANNSSYVGVALAHLAEPEKARQALLDPLSGWTVEHVCSGGMDQSPPDGGVLGRESFGRHPVRGVLAPLALMGMAAFGAGGLAGFNVRDRLCQLPIPTAPTSLALLAALARAPRPAAPVLRFLSRETTKSRLEWFAVEGAK